MLAHRHVVSRPYWMGMHRYVLNRMKVCPSIKVAPKVWRLDSGEHRRIYYTCDHLGWPTSWLYLRRRKGWQAWEVEQVWTFPEHRGQGLAETLYKAAINRDGILLASGFVHSPHSRALWARFVAKRLFNIWAQDLIHLDRTADVYLDDDGAVSSPLSIYHPLSTWQPRKQGDVRLLALRKDAP